MKDHKLSLFTAIKFDRTTTQYIQQITDNLDHFTLTEECLKESGEKLHITLNYLSPVYSVEPLVEQLARIRTDAFMLSIEDLGIFNNVHSDVIWLGVGGDTENLAQLKAAVDEASVAAGHPKEHRKYNPHITLAYSKKAQLIGKVCDAYSMPPQPFLVDCFHLMQVDQKTSTFELLHTFPLRNPIGA